MASAVPIRIGAHIISDVGEPYVIAEIGVNHNGQLSLAIELVDAAIAAGARAAKFQVFKATSLVTSAALSTQYQLAAGGPTSQQSLLQDLELTFDEFAKIRDHCRRSGIEFLATPFSIEDVTTLERLEVSAVKIASTDINNTPLLDRVIACGLPIILSTGASELKEIDATVDYLRRHQAHERLILLHCVSSYPHGTAQAGLSTIPLLKSRYATHVGYSDHTTEVEAAGLAVACGAKVLEKHLTLDRRMRGPDHAFSLTPELMRAYVLSARRAWEYLGEPRCGVADCEQEVRRLARKSVVSKTAIGRGTVLTAEMLTIKRPAGGIEPQYFSQLIGKTVRQNIVADTPMTWDMLN